MIYPSIAIFRRYASMLLVGTCFIFSSIKVRSSSVTRNLICIFLFLFSIGKIPFRFHRGFGILPNKQNLYLQNCGKKRFFTERVPLSYACYSTYSLISTTTEIHFCQRIQIKKCCNVNCNTFPKCLFKSIIAICGYVLKRRLL